MPDRLANIVNVVMEVPEWRTRLGNTINRKFGKWISSGRGIRALHEIRMPDGTSENEWIPSAAIVREVYAGQVIDPESLELSGLRRDIAYRKWDAANAPAGVRILAASLHELPKTSPLRLRSFLNPSD